MTDNSANVQDALTHATVLFSVAFDNRDAWRDYALYLTANPSAAGVGAADPTVVELYDSAVRADEDLADILAHPAHYRAEQARIASAAAVTSPPCTDHQ